MAQVFSVVRMKDTVPCDPGAPWESFNDAGKKPCSLAVTSAKGDPVLASDFLLHHRKRRSAACKHEDGNSGVMASAHAMRI